MGISCWLLVAGGEARQLFYCLFPISDCLLKEADATQCYIMQHFLHYR